MFISSQFVQQYHFKVLNMGPQLSHFISSVQFLDLIIIFKNHIVRMTWKCLLSTLKKWSNVLRYKEGCYFRKTSLFFKSKQFWQDNKGKKERGSVGLKTVCSFPSYQTVSSLGTLYSFILIVPSPSLLHSRAVISYLYLHFLSHTLCSCFSALYTFI